MITAILDIAGMHCHSCAVLIDEAVEALPGVASARTDMHRARTRVEYDPVSTDLDTITAAIAEVGYVALPA
jgi:Cu+-exporting ATPase